MGAPLEELRKELADVSARTTRFAIGSLTLIAFSSLTFARALRRVDSSEISMLIDKIGEAIFSHDTSPERASLIHTTIAKLSDAFTVELPITGAHLQVNLLYWSPLLPFLILASLAYLSIAAAKQQALRTIAVSRMKAGEPVSPLDRLTFGGDAPSSYSSYPARLGTPLYVGIIVALAINIIVALVTTTGDMALAFVEELRHLAVFSFYVWCMTRFVRRRILAEAASVAGIEPPHYRKRFERLRVWLAARARRWWRALTFGGSGMMLASLFMITASQSSCGGKKTGAQLFLGKDGAIWPPVDDFFCRPMFRIDSVGRWVYVAGIVLAALAIVFASIPPLARQQWLRDLFRGIAVVIFFFVVCSFGFVWVLFIGWPALIPPLWQLVYWVIPSLLYVWMTVIRKRKYAETWQRVGPALRVLYAPAWIIAPLALSEYEGSLVFFAGALCLAGAFVYAPAPLAATEEAPAPLGAVVRVAG
ncbi:MAG TPA: hypothetical protein VJ901_13845 [Thermoanaerobaculia bacterium]|nr:hypothetical protein [Thermoanaerobaculia bacterium]